MRITGILKKDHRVVHGMIMTLEATPRVSGTVRKSLFNQIRHQLLVHAQAEEDVFYPAVRNLRIGNVENIVQDAIKEHDNLRRLFGEIERLDPAGREFESKLGDLKRTFQHHVEEEEGKIFPMVERQWTMQQLEQIGQRFHNRKYDLKRMVAA
jgi:hemerythrin superfamily protein